MKNALKMVLALLLMAPVTVFADEASHRKAAEDLLLDMKVDKQTAEMFEQIKAMQKQQLQAMSQNMDPKDQESSMAMQDKIMDVMAQEMSWENVKDDYIAVYAQVFSEEDLRGLSEFYKSPLGQKLVDKTPELSTKMMEVGQKQTMKLLPKIREITDAAAREMQTTTQTPGSAPANAAP